MRIGDICTDKDMINYLVDCTLATLGGMYYKKTINKREFRRQSAIAQSGIDFLGHNYDFKNRASNVIEGKQTVLEYYSKKRKKELSLMEGKT